MSKELPKNTLNIGWTPQEKFKLELNKGKLKVSASKDSVMAAYTLRF